MVRVILILSMMTLVLSELFAQELLRPERNTAGTLINQDYFTMDHHPETVTLLTNVELGHFGKKVFRAFKDGRYQDVVADLNYALERISNHPGALSMLGAVAMETKVYSLPVPSFENALRLYPQYAYTHAQYGTYLKAIGSYDKAVQHLKEAIRLDPQLSSAYVWLSEAYTKSGKPELARQADKEARRLSLSGKIEPQRKDSSLELKDKE